MECLGGGSVGGWMEWLSGWMDGWIGGMVGWMDKPKKECYKDTKKSTGKQVHMIYIAKAESIASTLYNYRYSNLIQNKTNIRLDLSHHQELPVHQFTTYTNLHRLLLITSSNEIHFSLFCLLLSLANYLLF